MMHLGRNVVLSFRYSRLQLLQFQFGYYYQFPL